MNEKDKQIVADSFDVVVSAIPGFNVAWGLSKALYGAGLKLRQQRALEFIEMIRDNPAVFTQKLLSQEEFQDGFVYFLEQYLMARSEKKRRYLRNIFLGFSKDGARTDFELERFIQIIFLLNESDIEALKFVDTKTSNSYQLFDDQKYLDNIFNLINAGILYSDPSPRYGPIDSPFVYTSDLGRKFIKYLLKDIDY